MSGQHTPGPWIVDPRWLRDIQTASGEEIASAYASEVVGDTWVIQGEIPWSDETAQANARLIAAAPTLLEVAYISRDDLGRAADLLEHAGHREVAMRMRTTVDYLRAAITAATQPASIEGE